MNHFLSLAEFKLDQPSIVTIGVFDGVHRGHQHLLAPLVAEAHRTGRLAVVLTLFPHPDLVLRGLTGRYYLCAPEQKAKLLGELGVDVVVTQPFNDEVRHIRADAFVDQLLTHLNMSSLWVTADFAMGYQREGNFAFLTEQGRQKNFEVKQIDLLTNTSAGVISSTAIRQALMDGNVTQAAQWLGRPYQIEGEVVHGDHRGRTIGFPTANMAVWEEQVIPAKGVYACRARLGEEPLLGVTNVGERPTFGGTDIRIETHLLNFERDIYGQRLQIEFVARLRDEQKFSGLDALIQQIRADVEHGREILTTQHE